MFELWDNVLTAKTPYTIRGMSESILFPLRFKIFSGQYVKLIGSFDQFIQWSPD